MKWVRARRAATGDDGFTLIEVIASLVVLGLLASAAITVLINAIKVGQQNRNRVVAAQLASAQIEAVRGLRTQDITTGIVNLPDISTSGTTFHVQQSANYVDSNGTANVCDSPTGSRLGYKQITVLVTWDRMAGVKPVRSDTLKTLSIAGRRTRAKGTLAVVIKDSRGNPLPNQVVTVAPTGGAQTTDERGCVVFTNLPPASNYSAAVNTAGFVGPAGTQAVAQNALTVNGSQITKAQFDYDRAAALFVSWLAPVGAVGPLVTPGAIPVTLSNDYFPNNRQKAFLDCSDPQAVPTSCTSGNPRRITNLYPAAQGYGVWGGTCADAAPLTAPQPTNVSPGTSAAVSVRLGEVLTYVHTKKNPSANTTVYAVHAPDSSCPAGQSIALGTTDSSGELNALLPYGQWTIATNSSASSAPKFGWPVITVTSRNTIDTADVGPPVTRRALACWSTWCGRRDRDARRDDGFTLIEMMVTLGLIGLVVGILMVFTTGTLRNARHTDGQQTDLRAAQVALDATSRSLRSAVSINTLPVTLAFPAASAKSVSFYANNGTVTGPVTNAGPTLKRIYVNTADSTLVEESTPATINPLGSATPYTWSTANMTSRVLARNVLNPQPRRPDLAGAQTAGGPVFSYFDRSGALVPQDASGTVTTLGPSAHPAGRDLDLLADRQCRHSRCHVRRLAGADRHWIRPGRKHDHMKPPLTARMRGNLDDGFAMIMVLVTMLMVTAAVTLSLTIVTQNVKPARRDQDWNAALAAAQAGVDDYRRHLNDTDTYWLNGGVDAGNPALVNTGGRPIPGATGSQATYRYQILTSVAQIKSSGLIRLRSTGTVNGVNRTITVDLRKLGFLKYWLPGGQGHDRPGDVPAVWAQ